MTESIMIILSLLQEFGKCFSRKAAFNMFIGFVLAFLLAAQRKTIPRIYRFLGGCDHISNYHRFLSRSPWKTIDLSRTLFGIILRILFPLQSPDDRKRLILIVDSTTILKSGKKTDGIGRYHSSMTQRTEMGHEVVRLSIILDFPLAGTQEFPFMCRLYVTPDAIKERTLDVEYYSREAMAAKMLEIVRTWTDLPFLLIGDALYSKESTVNPVMGIPGAHLISRRLNGNKHGGVCWEVLPQEKKKGKGRPRKKGKEIKFNEIPLDLFSPCEYWHRFIKRTSMVFRLDNVTLRKFKKPVSVVIVLGKKKKRFVLLSTDMSLTTTGILELYRKRFLIEFGFRDSKQFMGFGDYQVRSLRSIEKHLTLSQIAYSIGKIAFMLCADLQKSVLELFYIKKPKKTTTFSMMRLQEELRDDYFYSLAGNQEKSGAQFHSLIFNHHPLSPSELQKMASDLQKGGQIAA